MNIIFYGIIFHEYHYIRKSVLTDPSTGVNRHGLTTLREYYTLTFLKSWSTSYLRQNSFFQGFVEKKRFNISNLDFFEAEVNILLTSSSEISNVCSRTWQLLLVLFSLFFTGKRPTSQMSRCAFRKTRMKRGWYQRRRTEIPPGYPSMGLTKFGPWILPPGRGGPTDRPTKFKRFKPDFWNKNNPSKTSAAVLLAEVLVLSDS